MKVGIITFHCSLNFGSVLQACALQTAVESTGSTATIIDYRSPDFDQYKLLPFSHPKRMLRNLLKFDRMIQRKKNFDSFRKGRLRMTENHYDSSSPSLSELPNSFDAFICGSDQIWNLNCTHGVVEPFFLSFAEEKRRVAYAPSLAHTSFEPQYFDKNKVAKLLARFDFLSVREEETVPLFQPLVNKKIEVVLDPTLLFDASTFVGLSERRVSERPYVFLYLLRRCPELIESAAQMASQGARVIYISEKNLPIPNATNLFGVGPEEFVSLIAHADAVLTNSFHATVFSILFHRPFRVFATDRSASRMRDLLGKLGVPERCVSSLDASLVEDADWNEVDRKLEELRIGSWDYLRRALS